MWSVRMRGEAGGLHITGAEGLYTKKELLAVLKGYTRRALTHPKGRPDKIVITLDRLHERPMVLKALPLCTIKCGSVREADAAVRKLLRRLGVSGTAIKTAYSVLKGRLSMRGASLVGKISGVRLEPDMARGIRVSRLGIKRQPSRDLSLSLSRLGLNTATVKEALTMATKVAFCPHIIAEVCISDDPEYTTGYVAGRHIGYLRIPNIKEKASRWGGRVFFINDDARIEGLIDYLEKRPVIIGRLSGFRGVAELDEILDSSSDR